MAELADAPDLGSGTSVCRFNSCYPHHKNECIQRLLCSLVFYMPYIWHDQPNGEAEIREYYEMAPGIVEAINQKSNAQEIWNEVYKDLVEPCVNMIRNNKNKSAYTLYKLYSLKLNQKYKA